MDQNQRSGEEEIVDNQRSGEETIGESHDADDETGESQSSIEENFDENQSSDEEKCEDQSSDEETLSEYLRRGADNYEDQSLGENNEWVGGKRCVLSDPAHPHYLSRHNGEYTNRKCCSCRKIRTFWEEQDNQYFHYYCAICQMEYHHMCHMYPSKIIHPHHPQHPLTFTFLNQQTRMMVGTNYREYCNYYNDRMPQGFHKAFEILSGSNLIFDKCTWCAKDLGQWFYRCQICNFSLDLDCNLRRPPLTVPNPKNHHHSLSLFPQPASLPCNVCGIINVKEPRYACYQCNYVVHQYCVDLPRVIKITRHCHRLSHTPYLPTKISLCRVCYKNVDIKYGQYSCNHDDCSFVVHSKCATHSNVWDGVELEWVPEKAEDIVAPYKEIGGGLIEHFSHHHHYLKLTTYDNNRDFGKQCHACMCSILSPPDEFYNCIECEFFLHEVCANLSTKLDHGLHNHSLFLDPNPPLCGSNLECDACVRKSSCWKYKCRKQECLEEKVQLDVNCILVPECFTHGSHVEHLLFMSTTYSYIYTTRCQRCKKTIYYRGLQCTVCEFALCYECATVPDKLYYKYDQHPLSLCYGESETVDGKYWCEVCETELDPTKWFYTNSECCTTIHVECVFGDSAFVKSDLTLDYQHRKVETLSNRTSSRPACHYCEDRCPHPVYFKRYNTDGTSFDFCSLYCLTR